MDRKVSVVEDLDGNKVVVIHDIRFKGKRSVEWDDVEKYLKQYVDDTERNYFVEVGIMSKDYENYYKNGTYINADGVDTGEDFYDIYDEGEEPKTDYENAWVTVTVFEIIGTINKEYLI